MRSVLAPLLRWTAVEELLSDDARLQAMLDIEAALARAEAAVGVIPAPAARVITACCQVGRLDREALARDARDAGNLAIPLVAQLTAAVRGQDEAAARFVHWGATSQDIIDTGTVIQLRAALGRMDGELARLGDGLAALARTHRATPVAARTWMQQALPTTFGVQVAGWLDAVERGRRRLAATRSRALVLQFGGAVGTLAALETRGLEVAAALGRELDLPVPDLPWHAHRDRLGEVASALGLCAGTLGKIGRDVALAARTEVGELAEPAAPGRGGSSTMPHKRNPVSSAVIVAAALRVPALVATMLTAMVQEEARGLGGWHAEWETLPEIVGLTGGALHHLTETVLGLEVDAARMRENLEAGGGLVFAEAAQTALASALGRSAAHELVAAACAEARAQGRHLRDVLAAHPRVREHLAPEAVDRLFDPGRYLGAADAMIERVLATHATAAAPASRRRD